MSFFRRKTPVKPGPDDAPLNYLSDAYLDTQCHTQTNSMLGPLLQYIGPEAQVRDALSERKDCKLSDEKENSLNSNLLSDRIKNYVIENGEDDLPKFNTVKELSENKPLLKPDVQRVLDVPPNDLVSWIKKNVNGKDQLTRSKECIAADTARRVMEARKEFLEQKPRENNKNSLIAYFKKLEGIVEQGKTANNEIEKFFKKTYRFKPTASRLNRLFVHMKNTCIKQTETLDNALDLKVYAVEVSKEWYDQEAELFTIGKETSRFKYNESRAVAGAKFATSAVLSPVLLPFAFFSGLGTLILGEGMLYIAAASLSGFAAPLQGYAHSTQKDFEGSQIKGELMYKIDQSDKVTTYLDPSSADDKKEAKALERDKHYIYIVEGQPSLKDGTNHRLGKGNELGHVVFTRDPQTALRIAKMHSYNQTKKYDPQAGWRLHRSWKDEQILKLRKLFSKNQPSNDDTKKHQKN